jgi:hypothetical protein
MPDKNFDVPRARENRSHKGLGARFMAAALLTSSLLSGAPSSAEAHSQASPTELAVQSQIAQLLRSDLKLTASRIHEPVGKTIAGIPTTQHYTEYETSSGVTIGAALNETQDGRPLIFNISISESHVSQTGNPADFFAKYFKPEFVDKIRSRQDQWRDLPSPEFGGGDKPKIRKETVLLGALPDGSHLSFAYIAVADPNGLGNRVIQVSILSPDSPYFDKHTAFQSAFGTSLKQVIEKPEPAIPWLETPVVPSGDADDGRDHHEGESLVRSATPEEQAKESQINPTDASVYDRK